jgi:hypothetical protein
MPGEVFIIHTHHNKRVERPTIEASHIGGLIREAETARGLGWRWRAMLVGLGNVMLCCFFDSVVASLAQQQHGALVIGPDLAPPRGKHVAHVACGVVRVGHHRQAPFVVGQA